MLEIRDARIQSGSYGQRFAAGRYAGAPLHRTRPRGLAARASPPRASARTTCWPRMRAWRTSCSRTTRSPGMPGFRCGAGAGTSTRARSASRSSTSTGIRTTTRRHRSRHWSSCATMCWRRTPASARGTWSATPTLPPSERSTRAAASPGNRWPRRGVGLWPAEPAMPQDASEAELQALLQACGYAHPAWLRHARRQLRLRRRPRLAAPGRQPGSCAWRRATSCAPSSGTTCPRRPAVSPTPATTGVLRALAPHRPAGQHAQRRRGPAHRHRAPATTWCAQGGVCQRQLVRRVVPQPGAQRRDDETRPGGRRRVGLDGVRQALPRRDGRARRVAQPGPAGRLVARHEFFHRLLLRTRIALPPVHPAAQGASLVP
jgi:hypothetical protein